MTKKSTLGHGKQISFLKVKSVLIDRHLDLSKLNTYLSRKFVQLALLWKIASHHRWVVFSAPLRDFLEGEVLIVRHVEVADLGAFDIAFLASGLVSQVPDGYRVLGRLVCLTVDGVEVIHLLFGLVACSELLHWNSLIGSGSILLWSSFHRGSQKSK